VQQFADCCIQFGQAAEAAMPQPAEQPAFDVVWR
jgi:hypothetical protein